MSCVSLGKKRHILFNVDQLHSHLPRKNYSIVELELLAIVWALGKIDYYTRGAERGHSVHGSCILSGSGAQVFVICN